MDWCGASIRLRVHPPTHHPFQHTPIIRNTQTRVLLTGPELATAVLEGRFKEAKWTQTVAMALLHLLLREQEAGITLLAA